MPGLLIFAFAVALGGGDPASASPAAQTAKTAKSDVVCTYESQPDSHFKKRVCLTKAERDARAELERNNLQNKQRAFCSGGQC
jgi:hypothetical protein